MDSDIGTLKLSHGKHVVIFDMSFEKEISKHSWVINTNGYVRCRNNTCGYTYMHQFVLGFSGNGKMSPDHINRVKTDNRRCNLRIVSQSENAKNVRVRSDYLSATCVTEKEVNVLNYLNDYIEDNGVFPTYSAFMNDFNLKSPNSLTQYLDRLMEKGLIERHPVKKYIFKKEANEFLS